MNISKCKHCIFDFDGVIIDSERKKFQALQRILAKRNIVIPESDYLNFIGKKRGLFLREKVISNVVEIMTEIHESDKLIDFQPINGLSKFLTFLQKNNIKMHIATGSERKFVYTILEKYDIKKYFTHIITGEEVQESKPSPIIYEEMKKKLNNESAFVIEDSPAGVQSAKAASLFVISLLPNSQADICVKRISDISQFV